MLFTEKLRLIFSRLSACLFVLFAGVCLNASTTLKASPHLSLADMLKEIVEKKDASVFYKRFWNEYLSGIVTYNSLNQSDKDGEGKGSQKILFFEKVIRADLEQQKQTMKKNEGRGWEKKFREETLKDYGGSESEYVFRNLFKKIKEYATEEYMNGSFHNYQNYTVAELHPVFEKIKKWVKDNQNKTNYFEFAQEELKNQVPLLALALKDNDNNILKPADNFKELFNYMKGDDPNEGFNLEKLYRFSNINQIEYGNGKKGLYEVVTSINNDWWQDGKFSQKELAEKVDSDEEKNLFYLEQATSESLKGVLTGNQIAMSKVWFSLKKPLSFQQLYFPFSSEKDQNGDLSKGITADNFDNTQRRRLWMLFHYLWYYRDEGNNSNDSQDLTPQDFKDLIYNIINNGQKGSSTTIDKVSNDHGDGYGLLQQDASSSDYNHFFKQNVYQTALTLVKNNRHLKDNDHPVTGGDKIDFKEVTKDDADKAFGKQTKDKDFERAPELEVSGDKFKDKLNDFLKDKISFTNKSVNNNYRPQIRFINLEHQQFVIFYDMKGLHFLRVDLPWNDDGTTETTIKKEISDIDEEMFAVRTSSKPSSSYDYRNNRKSHNGFGKDNDEWGWGDADNHFNKDNWWYLAYLINREQEFMMRKDRDGDREKKITDLNVFSSIKSFTDNDVVDYLPFVEKTEISDLITFNEEAIFNENEEKKYSDFKKVFQEMKNYVKIIKNLTSTYLDNLKYYVNDQPVKKWDVSHQELSTEIDKLKISSEDNVGNIFDFFDKMEVKLNDQENIWKRNKGIDYWGQLQFNWKEKGD